MRFLFAKNQCKGYKRVFLGFGSFFLPLALDPSKGHPTKNMIGRFIGFSESF